MIKLIAHIPRVFVDERWRVPSGEQREKDSSEEDEQSNENAVIAESGHRTYSRARDVMSELSSVFLFHRQVTGAVLG